VSQEHATVNVNRDETNRRLRDADKAHAASMPLASSAMRQAFDPSSGTDAATKGSLIGLPTDRRGFLRIGGLTVAASALLVACGGGDDRPVAQTGSVPPREPNVLRPDVGPELDLTLVLTAQSIENLAVATYDAALENDWLGDATLNSVAQLFRDQHQDHAALLADTARELGGTPFDEANPYLAVNVVEPAVASLGALEGAELVNATLELAYALENTAAQTYVQASGLLTEAVLRQAAMSIGGVEARHVTVLLGALEYPQVAFAFLPVGAAAPTASYITDDGPVTTPSTTVAPETTTTTVAEG